MSLNGTNRNNFHGRLVPNIARLIPDDSDNAMMGSHANNNGYGSNAPGGDSAGASSRTGGVAVTTYEDSDLNTITRSQMNQDLLAYRYDLEFCQLQLTTQSDLSPQEIRTLQIRVLDCGHNIRHCRHRIQMLDVQARLGITPFASGAARGPNANANVGNHHGGVTATPANKYKRQRLKRDDLSNYDAIGNADGDPLVNGDLAMDDHAIAMALDADRPGSPPGETTHAIQRLGYWDCRLCKSRKYLEAGPNRVPSAPCKWPLKDISKMINHFLDLHTEHSPAERCSELGDALARNRGPFEYWLTRTKAQDIDNANIIDEYIHMLQEGSLPHALRGLLRAATLFPNAVSNSYKK
ncbi:hypothetical protein GGR50DRAFT_676266 [Xylaria sp. CBS 124048]|nr:hypothetical protein GGR50DRAFT_676266 [Xylaria sp. CBS 124048]